MKCQIDSCAGFSTDRFLWKCIGCNFTFHPSCAGVQRNNEMDILNYMAPMCKKCSTHLLDQHSLSLAFKSQNHSIKSIQGSIEGFEQVLERIDASLVHMETVKETKKHVEELIKTSKSTNDFLLVQMEALRTELSSELKNSQNKKFNELEDKLKPILQSVAEELITLQTIQESSIRIPSHDDLLDEIRHLSNRMLATDKNEVTSKATKRVPSLADELAIPSTSTSSSASTNCTGWRIIGNKRVWKPQNYWDDYDRRMKIRAEQQKRADRAKRRHRQKQRQNRDRNLFDNIRRNHINVNRTNNRAHLSELPAPTSHNMNNRNRHNNLTSNGQSDRELLAAAKVTFAGGASTGNLHPSTGARYIAFRQGETLNPYRSSTITSSSTPVTTLAGATSVSTYNHFNGAILAPAVASSTCVAPSRLNNASSSQVNSCHVSSQQSAVRECSSCRELQGPNFLLY